MGGKLLFIDLETGGLDHLKHSVLSVGYILYDDTEDQILKSGGFFLKQYEYVVTGEALEVNKLDIREVYRKGISIYDFYKKLKNMVNMYGKLTLAGWNVGFDQRFLMSLLGYRYENVFHYKALDVASLYYAWSRKWGSLEEVAKELLDKEDGDFHTATYDVWVTLQIYKFLKDKIRRR